MGRFAAVTSRARAALARARARSPAFDHWVRTFERYSDEHVSRLAAGAAYFAFFATFALGVVGYAVLGILVDHHVDLRHQVDDFLQANLPVVEPSQLAAGSGTAGLFGLLGLVVTGLGWLEAVRASQRQLWGLSQQPGNTLLRRLADLVLLILLGLLLGISLALTGVLQYLLSGLPLAWLLSWLLPAALNLLLAVVVLTAVPRLRISPRRVLPPALAVAVGLVVLNTVGGWYITRVQENPAYSVVATAAGLLVYLYLVHHLVLGAAAWAATDRHGRFVDLVGEAQTEK